MAILYRRRFLLWTAMLVFMVGSVVSAAMMAPDRSDAAGAQIAILGMTVDDLCGVEAGHDHRCPYCHLLPDTPIAAPAGNASFLLPFTAWHQAGDLHRAAQARDHARSPRAPPSIA